MMMIIETTTDVRDTKTSSLAFFSSADSTEGYQVRLYNHTRSYYPTCVCSRRNERATDRMRFATLFALRDTWRGRGHQ